MNRPVIAFIVGVGVTVIGGLLLDVTKLIRIQLGGQTLEHVYDLSADDPYKEYEWQWAGENWYGRLLFERSNGRNMITAGKVGVIKKDPKTDLIWMDGKVMDLAKGVKSSFEITDTGIKTDLTVDKPNRHTKEIVLERIHGSLRHVSCYVGGVTYSSSKGNFTGDMVLVSPLSSSLGTLVEDWFKNDNNSWLYDVK